MTEHQQAVKRIIRYVVGTLDHDIYYPRCPGEAHIVGYSDSDHAGDIDTSKSTSTRGILFFGKCLVSWQSVKQQVVTLSSYEAEYIAAPPLRLRCSGLFDCLVIYSAETLERWNSRWTVSLIWPCQRTLFFMNGVSTSG
jgi:hypothetical protein